MGYSDVLKKEKWRTSREYLADEGRPRRHSYSSLSNTLSNASLNSEGSTIPDFEEDEEGRDHDQFFDEEEEQFLDHEALICVNKMAEMLENGNDHERSIVLFEFQQMLDYCFEDTLEILVPIICLHVHTWSSGLQLATAEALIDLVRHDLTPDVSKMVSAASFRVVNRVIADTVHECWSEILVMVLPNVNWNEQELARVISLVNVHASRTSDASRKLAARLLGALSMSLSAADVEKLIVHRALYLCSDKNVEVRGMAAESLDHIGSKVPLGVMKERLWPKIVQLFRDPQVRIRAATLRCIAHIVEAHRETDGEDSFYSQDLPPVFLEQCLFSRRKASEDQRTIDDDSYLMLEIFSEVIGQFVVGIHKYLNDENELEDAYRAFRGMAAANGPILRRNCAYNMPAIAQCLGPKFAEEVASLAELLSRDSDAEARWNLAAGIHKTVPFLIGGSTVASLYNAVQNLLRDENPLVRTNILRHFPDIVRTLTTEQEHCSALKLSPLFRSLKLLSEGNWRTQELLVRQLDELITLVPSNLLKMNILPLLSQLAEESTSQVRKASMHAIVKGLRYIPEVEEREQMVETFCVEWAEGGVFWMRIAFLDAVLAAHSLYSRKLFKACFASQILLLGADPVPNVRLHLAKILGAIGGALADEPQFQKTLRLLNQDEDIDVREAICGIEEILRKERACVDASLVAEDRARAEEEDKFARSVPSVTGSDIIRTPSGLPDTLDRRKPASRTPSSASRLDSFDGQRLSGDRDFSRNSENARAGHSKGVNNGIPGRQRETTEDYDGSQRLSTLSSILSRSFVTAQSSSFISNARELSFSQSAVHPRSDMNNLRRNFIRHLANIFASRKRQQVEVTAHAS
ncbi:hypothetical protein NDN08_007891 [Rhodosorus marinus]|uniref:Uncharacterized protein n=1 Tax=Rhodosorus marinus TaxID=101924 RepID=A0AAV8V2F7_9RHOD|nr:hypothetical protein NDN08_007891 [Rhodosorus marinus]